MATQEVDPTIPVTTQTFPCPNVTLHYVSQTDILKIADKIQNHWGATGQFPNKGEMMDILLESGVEWDMRALSVHPRDPESEFWKEPKSEPKPKRHEVSLDETP